uniref:Suprabasin n=1 Tax=Canis lupus familiaris TaxID=9615 RepID=A0A8I3MMZ0_CANLF
MHLASVVSSCSLLLLLGALPGWAANDDPIEKVIEGINRGLTNAEREVGKALEGINNGITHAGREVEKVFNGLSHMGSQAGKELDKGVQGLNSGLDKVAHEINSGIGQAGKEAEKFVHGVNNAAGQAGKEADKVVQGVHDGVNQAGKEAEKFGQGVHHAAGQAGKEAEKLGQGVHHAAGQAGKEVDRLPQNVHNGVNQAGKEANQLLNGAHPGVSTGQHQHGGGATTTLTSGASVNRPFISFPTLWQVSARGRSTRVHCLGRCSHAPFPLWTDSASQKPSDLSPSLAFPFFLCSLSLIPRSPLLAAFHSLRGKCKLAIRTPGWGASREAAEAAPSMCSLLLITPLDPLPLSLPPPTVSPSAASQQCAGEWEAAALSFPWLTGPPPPTHPHPAVKAPVGPWPLLWAQNEVLALHFSLHLACQLLETGAKG